VLVSAKAKEDNTIEIQEQKDNTNLLLDLARSFIDKPQSVRYNVLGK